MLVTSDNVCKISDFGIQRSVYATRLFMLYQALLKELDLDLKMPVRWMAPECLPRTTSSKCDVWAFGVVIWEIIAFAPTPYAEGVWPAVHLSSCSCS